MLPFWTGLGLGFVVAAQVGPVSLMAVHGVLRQGPAVGLAVGLGAALVDTAYGALGLVGVAAALQDPEARTAVGAVGAAVLVGLGLAALRSARADRRADPRVPRQARSAPAAFGLSLAATAANPLTIISWASLFTATSTAGRVETSADAVLLLVGIGLGTFTWFAALTGVAHVVRRGVGPRVQRSLDVVVGLVLVAFGVALGWRTIA